MGDVKKENGYKICSSTKTSSIFAFCFSGRGETQAIIVDMLVW